jgi:hypothetical protein
MKHGFLNIDCEGRLQASSHQDRRGFTFASPEAATLLASLCLASAEPNDVRQMAERHGISILSSYGIDPDQSEREMYVSLAWRRVRQGSLLDRDRLEVSGHFDMGGFCTALDLNGIDVAEHGDPALAFDGCVAALLGAAIAGKFILSEQLRERLVAGIRQELHLLQESS